jgi:hypothetical protein
MQNVQSCLAVTIRTKTMGRSNPPIPVDSLGTAGGWGTEESNKPLKRFPKNITWKEFVHLAEAEVLIREALREVRGQSFGDVKPARGLPRAPVICCMSLSN